MNVVEERVQYEQRTLSRSIDQRLAGLAARSTVAMVLAGGRGTRLKQLTDWRAKPAVSFAGKFRIIDFALSNCINSGIRRIDICTQYKAHSRSGSRTTGTRARRTRFTRTSISFGARIRSWFWCSPATTSTRWTTGA